MDSDLSSNSNSVTGARNLYNKSKEDSGKYDIKKFANFQFATVTLPNEHENHACFHVVWKKILEGFSNPYLLRCYMAHYNPPPNYEELESVTNISTEYTEEEILEFQQWMRNQKIHVQRFEVNPTDCYAAFNHDEDVIIIQKKLWDYSDKSKPDQKINYEFILWAKLLHEFGHLVLYRRHLKDRHDLGRSSPVGFYGREAGAVVERFIFGAAFAHYGQAGFRSILGVIVSINLHRGFCTVPQEWMQKFFDESIESFPAQSFRVSFKWKEGFATVAENKEFESNKKPKLSRTNDSILTYQLDGHDEIVVYPFEHGGYVSDGEDDETIRIRGLGACPKTITYD